MSVKDRTIDGPADHVRIVLTACREYEIVETGKPSTASFRKYKTSSPPLRVVEWPWRIGMHVFTFSGLSYGSADYM